MLNTIKTIEDVCTEFFANCKLEDFHSVNEWTTRSNLTALIEAYGYTDEEDEFYAFDIAKQAFEEECEIRGV